jgi:outer membrane receptor protein involved in Fe transport
LSCVGPGEDDFSKVRSHEKLQEGMSMYSTSKLSCAIAAILGSSAAGLSLAATPAADTDSDSIQEITVTAQRRTENVQDVPITIQALTAETLSQLNVQTFDQFVKYLPNVTAPTNGPGQGSIFMRGLSVGAAGTQSSGSIGGFPNVAIYLDDQSGQLPGRNLDVYAADLERVEVLEGPQGTLFGAGAQAGVVRYITNKPVMNETSGSVTAGYGTTAHGDPNSDVTAVLNLPLITDTLAARAVIYNDSRGGYINNVPGTFTRKDTDLGIYYAHNPGGGVPAGSPVINNNAVVGNAINPVTYQGIRGSVLWDINDDWNALITQTYQNMNAQGVFYQMPNSSDGTALPELSVTLFNPSYDKDRFENTAWTLNGKVGDLKLVYTGAYLVRNVHQVQDYTNYARGVYADYYQCYGPGTGYAVNGGKGDPNLKSTCYSPSSTWEEIERNTHQSHELRLSTPDDWRLRGLVGAFWEQQKIEDETDWLYKTVPSCSSTLTTGCFSNLGIPTGASAQDPNAVTDNTAFFEEVQRGYRQYAFFGSTDFDIIPKTLTVTFGTRYYNFHNTETGTVNSSFYCFEQGTAPCVNDATNLNAENLNSTYSGFKSRANLTYHVTSDIMLYYTWSQGFRPGGFNRTSTCHKLGDVSVANFCTPQEYGSDSLTNNEVGWKTEWLDHRFQWNGAVYQENWNNVQFGFFDPGQLGNLAFGANGPDYRIRGVETSVVAVLTKGLTLQGGSSWNSSEQTNSPYLIANNPALLTNPATAGLYGQPITAFKDPYGPIGSPSANSPPLQFNARLRYDFNISSYTAFWQIGATHTAHSYTQAGSNPSLSSGGAINTTLLRFEDPGYTEYDASIGVAKDNWNVQAFGQNLTDVIESVFTSSAQFTEAQTVTRPRVLGVKFGYKF